MKKAGKITAIVFMGLIILFNILTAVANVTGKSAVSGWLPFTFLSVETGSMEPEISAGDLIIDFDADYEDIRVGDTVTFRQAGSYITHKVVRTEGSRLITKGVANNAEDKSIGPEDYYGKTVAVIPGMGKLLTFLGSPVALICAAILLFGVFYGRNIVLKIEEKTEKETGKDTEKETGKKKAGRPGFSYVKLAGYLLALSFLAVSPTMTAAKYTAKVNGNAAVAAGRRYISSNFLKSDGSEYDISGWNGSSYGITVTVSNSYNRLKYNKSGQDLLYKFIAIRIANEDGVTYNTNYSMQITPQTGLEPVSEETAQTFTYSPELTAELEATTGEVVFGPYLIEGNDESITTHSFDFLLESDLLNPLLAGDKVRFKLYAVTDYSSGYYLDLVADMTMEVSGDGNFIRSLEKSTAAGTSLVEYTIKTGLVDGSAVKNVKVNWDNTQVYLFVYEKNAFEIIRNRDESFYHPGDDTDHDAYLIVPLTAYSEVGLQFFKYDIQDENDDIDISAVLYNVSDTGEGGGDDESGGGDGEDGNAGE